MITRYLIVQGNPVDGFNFIGPFITFEEAEEYAKNKDSDWWITEMQGPL